LKRFFLSLFFALVGSGVTFYLILFCSLAFYLFVKGVNSTEAPGLVAALRHIALPVSAITGAVLFVLALRRKPRHVSSCEERPTERDQMSSKLAAK
jgi:TRAP-type C4-dicarboxylate transport system permease small subunit